jgi:DNA replication protein DnaC
MSVCAICDGVGLVRVVNARANGSRAPASARRWCAKSAAWPPRTSPSATAITPWTATRPPFAAPTPRWAAHLTARKFVEAYPVDTAGKGLLFTGSIGVGKTHLAVGVLRRLVQERGVKGLFCDYRELLKSIQNSYNPQVQHHRTRTAQAGLCRRGAGARRPGRAKPNEWVWDTVALILNTRYNDKQTTIITTNYPDLPAGTPAPAWPQWS